MSSPFLLGATIVHHLAKYDSPVADSIRNNVYVDNVMIGASDVKSAISTYAKAKQIFRDCSMNLREWVSNSTEFTQALPKDDKVEGVITKVLDVQWRIQEDTFSVPPAKGESEQSVCTKRTVLKQIAQLFHPLGLFLPVTILGKLFLQKLWLEKLDWDKPVSDSLNDEWITLRNSLQSIPEHKLQRFLPICSSDTYSLLAFCDASQRCYATAIYLLNESAHNANLIFAKGRVKPTKDISLPRLKLMAVLIGVRALLFVKRELRLPIRDTILWTDSQCVLHWLQSKKSLSVFVANRMKEIKAALDIEFRYVRTTENPADLPSRGKLMHELPSLWWVETSWLQESKNNWPTEGIPELKQETATAYEKELKTSRLYEVSLAVTETVIEAPFGISEVKYSYLTKLIRVTAWCFKFISKLQKRIPNRQELCYAKQKWISYIQDKHLADVKRSIRENKPLQIISSLNVVLDDKGTLRCSGRLEHAANLDYEAKYPKLLPQKSHFTKLIILSVQTKLFHAGVSHTLAQIRNEFWIHRGRTEVKSVINGWLICKKNEGGPYVLPNMPNLANPRASPHPAFSYVGIDYMGPLYVKSSTGGAKVWICLFTCLTVRAIHLEPMKQLSAEQFLFCLRRFIVRREKPIQIISDNALQFKLSSSVIETAWKESVTDPDVINFRVNETIEWKFIVELLPWAGGFYERMVGLVKRSLRKSLGKLSFTFDQLNTLIIEIESTVNSRPLVYVSEDENPGQLITPALFLSVNPNLDNPNLVLLDQEDPDFFPQVSSQRTLLEFWKKGLSHLDTFWNVWHRDYLLSLREKLSFEHSKPRIHATFTPSVGNVVLIKDPFLPRGKWKLDRIKSIVSGGADNIRGVSVQLPNKKLLRRSVNLLYPLECGDDMKSIGVHIPPKPPDVTQLPLSERRSGRMASKEASERITHLAEYFANY